MKTHAGGLVFFAPFTDERVNFRIYTVDDVCLRQRRTRCVCLDKRTLPQQHIGKMIGVNMTRISTARTSSSGK